MDQFVSKTNSFLVLGWMFTCRKNISKVKSFFHNDGRSIKCNLYFYPLDWLQHPRAHFCCTGRGCIGPNRHSWIWWPGHHTFTGDSCLPVSCHNSNLGLFCPYYSSILLFTPRRYLSSMNIVKLAILYCNKFTLQWALSCALVGSNKL